MTDRAFLIELLGTLRILRDRGRVTDAEMTGLVRSVVGQVSPIIVTDLGAYTCSGCAKQLAITEAYFDTVSGKVECQGCAGIELNA